ncbi:MAG: AMP-binding protein, partial [Bacteroidota bacterium]|nr:AMP-binding protein [Bacteroidota bacterium]
MDENLHALNHTTPTYMPVKDLNSVDGNANLASEEWLRIVNEFNNTEAPYPKEKTLFAIFEEQVLKSPDAVALRKGNKTITYNELNKQANRLANLLIDGGILPEDNIGLLVTRDFEMVIGMMAILKSGGAYVPIDPEYPIDRQEYIFNQSLLKMVIADKDYPLQKLIDEKKFIVIDFNNLSVFDDKNPGLKINSKQLAYTIYTSGSTGRPKGVMIEHHSAVNLVLWVNDRYNVGTNDRLLFITSMCFDLSVYDIFGMLSAGGTLVIAENREIQNVRTLQDMLVKYDITFWDSV